MNKLFIFFFVFVLISSFAYAEEVCKVDQSDCNTTTSLASDIFMAAQNNDAKFSEESLNDSVCITYFYGDGCPHCAEIKPYIESVEQKYGSKIHIEKYEIYHNLKNYQLYNQYCAIQNIDISNRGIPLIAINDKFFMGNDQIKEGLETEIESMLKSGLRVCPLPDSGICQQISAFNKTSVSSSILGFKTDKITLPLVITTGLLDGINPCAFAVLLFLLTFLLEVSNNKKRMVKAGIAYTFAVYVTYFLAGLGLLSAIQMTGMSRIVLVVAAIFAIFAGIVNVKDYFWYGKGFSLKIPESKKKIIENWTKKANIPAALVLGFLVSMFELPCTGGVYLAILAMLAKTGTKMAAIPYLLLYNLMFILPLVIIIVAVTFGMRAEHIENWRDAKKNVMRLVLGLLLIILGLGLLLGWF